MQIRCKRLKEKISSYSKELEQSDFYHLHFKSAVKESIKHLDARKIEQLLCYGLGSFSAGVEIVSRFQLALLILLYRLLKELGEPINPIIETFDPSFDQVDIETLKLFQSPQFELLAENEHCARKLTTSSKDRCLLVYMPHLDKYLYNNLLGVNWTTQNLSRLLVFGNSFQEMIDNEPKSKCSTELYYLSQLVSNFTSASKRGIDKKHLKFTSAKKESGDRALIEIKLDDESFLHKDVFNSLAFHLMNSGWLSENEQKIEGSRLSEWTCVTTCQTVDDWNDS